MQENSQYTFKVYTVKFVYNDAVYKDIPGITIPSNVFGWFYV